MHKINVLSFGSKNFNTSLEELKDHFNFKLTLHSEDPVQIPNGYEVLLIHSDFFEKNSLKNDVIKKKDIIKIFISKKNKEVPNFFKERILLPISISELNNAVENSVAKNNFVKNSGIIIKNYNLNKNEKKLSNGKDYILLTEKEIHLLEILLSNKKDSIHKDEILKKVWKYAEDADTHTVETHIYRLRKKIKDKFFDEEFIRNNKDGYSL